MYGVYFSDGLQITNLDDEFVIITLPKNGDPTFFTFQIINPRTYKWIKVFEKFDDADEFKQKFNNLI